MAFHKSFPYQKAEGAYTTWVEVSLTDAEEKELERKAREDHIKEYETCLDDAREIILKNKMKLFDSNIISIANSLFEKRSSHAVYYKESAAKDKFDAQYGKK